MYPTSSLSPIPFGVTASKPASLWYSQSNLAHSRLMVIAHLYPLKRSLVDGSNDKHKLASHFKVMPPSHYFHTLLSLCGMAFILLDWRWACSPLDSIDVKGMDCHIKWHWPSMLCCSCQCCCCVESGSAALQTGI